MKIGFEPQGLSCKMCKSVLLKWGHTNVQYMKQLTIFQYLTHKCIKKLSSIQFNSPPREPNEAMIKVKKVKNKGAHAVK